MGRLVRALFFDPSAKKNKVKGQKNDLLLLVFRVINGTTKKGRRRKNADKHY